LPYSQDLGKAACNLGQSVVLSVCRSDRPTKLTAAKVTAS